MDAPIDMEDWLPEMGWEWEDYEWFVLRVMVNPIPFVVNTTRKCALSAISGVSAYAPTKSVSSAQQDPNDLLKS